MRCSPPGSSSSPHGKRCLLEAAARGVLPLGLGRQPRARPARSRPRRRASDTCTTGWSPRSVERRTAGLRDGASRRRAPAATTGAGRDRACRGKSSGSRPPNTNDQPKRSASVTWPVASTNAAKRVVGDRVRVDRERRRARPRGPGPRRRRGSRRRRRCPSAKLAGLDGGRAPPGPGLCRTSIQGRPRLHPSGLGPRAGVQQAPSTRSAERVARHRLVPVRTEASSGPADRRTLSRRWGARQRPSCRNRGPGIPSLRCVTADHGGAMVAEPWAYPGAHGTPSARRGACRARRSRSRWRGGST